jgi:cysteine-rich repeat protein
MSQRRALLWFLVLLGGCGVDVAQKDRCHDDSQCNSGRVCVDSFCRPRELSHLDAAVDAATTDLPGGEAVADLAEPADAQPPDVATPDGAGATCGDGTMQVGEDCDDGNRIDDDACSNDCTKRRCGNGVTEAGEECDDGNSSAGDRCTPSCTWVPFSQLAASGSHICGLRTNGMVTCWGSPEDRCTPPERAFSSIAVGEFASCGITEQGLLSCWGDASGVPPTPDVNDSVAVGADFACAVSRTHELSCWGVPSSPAVRGVPGGEFVRVAAGGSSVCAIALGGQVRCWGGPAAIDTDVPNGAFVDIAVGRFGACARDADGVTTCWGMGAKRELRFRAVFVGDDGICGVDESGLVTCWGGPLYQAVVPSGRFTQVAATHDMICGVRDSGAVSCWGLLTPTSELSPTAPPLRAVFAGYDGDVCGLDRNGMAHCPVYPGAPGLPDGPFESLAIGPTITSLSSSTACGQRLDGSVVCWGDSPLTKRIPPGPFRQVVVPQDMVCLLDEAGQVKCWGETSPVESYGEMPVPPGEYEQLSAGILHVCALKTDQTLACWSSDSSWDAYPPPQGSYLEVASGRAASCAVRVDGRTVCWGPLAPPNMGPSGLHQIGTVNGLGYGLTEAGEIAVWGHNPPKAVPAGPFESLVVGKGPCALRRNGELVCFGGPVVNGDSPR